MYLILLLFSALLAYGAERQSLCLNMIVKNEAPVICRCLSSVKDRIDYWVIVDTGSTDGTQEIIRRYLKDIPGELYERPWKNWGETRSEAFDLAKDKGDYVLFMDADDVLEFEKGFEMPPLTEGQYNMWRGNENYSYQCPRIVKGDLPWKWIGVTHEYLGCDEPFTSALLENVHYTSIGDGASHHDPEKFWKNVRLLEEGLKNEPCNARYAFYLAESYRDCGEKAKALEWYQKRVDMGGWPEEVFCSKLQIGHMLKALGLPASILIEAYKDAFYSRIHRVEPIYYIAEVYNKQENYQQAYEMLRVVDFVETPEKKDTLFNEDWIADYGLLFQKSICAYYVGHYEEALADCDQLLAKKNLPEGWRKLTESNRTFPIAKLESVKE